jgi:hypothetical protein
MESLGYTIMYMINKELVPWKGVTDREEMIKMKTDFIEKDVNPAFRGIKTFIKRC